MLPGKTYKPDDFLLIAWTRKWFIILPALLVTAGTVAYSHYLPDRYSSSTTILVVPQRVPESYVRSTVTTSVAERLQTISQQILSRTKLERIIEEFNLYEAERKTMIMEDIVELMRRRDIKINISSSRNNAENDATHFSVSYESPQPRTAMLVADRLASMFVQENLQAREVLADSTNQFLQSQLEDARRRLLEHEAKLEAFRNRNSGQLPTQVQSNLQMMQVTQAQIQANSDAANRDGDRLAVLDAAIAEALTTLSPAAPSDTTAPRTAEQQLQALRTELRAMEQRLKPSHPDIAQAKRLIANLEAKVARESGATGSAVNPASPSGGPANVVDKVTNMRLEAEQLRRSLDTRRAEDERLKRVLASYTMRLEAAPKLESELTELTRDYRTLQEQYESLLRKSEESKIAVNLERRQIGEQFKVIDGARLPERPVSPDRLRINLMGLLGGLALGVGLVALLAYRDTTIKTDDDVVMSLALPVLAVIPAMITAADRARQKRRRVMLGASVSLVIVLAAAAAIAWQMRLLQAWVR